MTFDLIDLKMKNVCFAVHDGASEAGSAQRLHGPPGDHLSIREGFKKKKKKSGNFPTEGGGLPISALSHFFFFFFEPFPY